MNELCFGNRLIYKVNPELPPLLLEEMLEQVKGYSTVDGTVGTNHIRKSIRKSAIHWLPWDHWIAGVLHNIMISANNDFFKFDLDHFSDGIQITRYDPGGHYTWHRDSTNGKTRKLSISLLLNDDYTGGELELESKPDSFLCTPKAGEAILFPSWLSHRVKPVKTGHRISLVAWMNGPEFK